MFRVSCLFAVYCLVFRDHCVSFVGCWLVLAAVVVVAVVVC